MSECKYHTQAHRYAAGLLTGRELEEFEKHIEVCAECVSTIEELKKLNEIMGRVERIKPAPDFMGRVSRAIEEKELEEQKTGSGGFTMVLRRNLLPVAACFCVIFSLLVLLQTPEAGVTSLADSSSSGLESEVAALVSYSAYTESDDQFLTGQDSAALEKFYEITFAMNTSE